ncbi:MAG: cyclic nucleotide-binding domain-containing protein [Verrucomicrobia bacterium]|nr:cyclic nucleotide-binding domain-containing protein [Verrucomicrobiota bacterium]
MNLLENRFFKYFTETGVKTLAERSTEVTCPDQTILFEEGQPSDGIYMVLEGDLQLSKRSGGDRQVMIAMVHPGDYFGELGVLDGSARSARATAKGTVRVAKIPGEVLLKVLYEEPARVTLQLFARILEYLRATNDRFVNEVVRKEKFHFVGEMASNIIHDFKNPISAIQLSAELISTKYDDPATQRKCSIIVQQSQRMVMMVQELLDFARGNPVLRTEIQTVENFFEEFEKLNRDLFAQSKVTVTIQSCKARIEMDKGRMLRVMQNLATNAVEALRPAGGEIKLFANENGDWVDLYFQDNGPGIPESIRDNFFQPFVTHGKASGTGLGMAIVKTTIDAHKGQICFQTVTGKGTTFIIRLPKYKKPKIAPVAA